MMEKAPIRIGGSEAAIILGVSTFGTPLTLYLEKKGLRARPDISEREYVKWGKRLEEPVAAAYAEETKRELYGAPGTEFPTLMLEAEHVEKDEIGHLFRNKERPWMQAHPDRFIWGKEATSSGSFADAGVLEAKTAMFMKKEDWGDEPPLPYQIQLQHYLAVLGLSWGSLAVLIGGNTFRWQDQDRNNEFIKMLVEKELDFLKRIENDDPPDPVGDDRDRRALAEIFKRDVDKVIQFSPEAIELDERLADAKAKKKEAEVEELLCGNLLRQMMGDASVGILPNGRGSWKRSTVNVKAEEQPRAAHSYEKFTRLKK